MQKEGRQCILSILKCFSGCFMEGDIVLKSRDVIKLHREKYNVNSVISLLLITSRIVIRLVSFNKIILFIKN